MTDTAQTIISALNEPPFEKDLSLIKFDTLQPLELLQIFNDVLSELGPEHKVELRDEDPEQTLVRMLSMLRVLKYKPPGHVDIKEFRHGLIAGDKEVIYHILGWLLPKLGALKTRAYLARYLVKLDVPADILQNDEVAATYEKYNALIENFKGAHKEVEELRNSGFSSEVVRKDIQAMERELESLTKRTERMREKAKGFPKYEEMLQAAKKLRLEQQREDELQSQAQDQRAQLDRMVNKHSRVQEQLREVRSTGVVGGSDGLMRRIQEENSMFKFLSGEKLPQEIEMKRNAHAELMKVVQQPSMFQDDLNELNTKIDGLQADINQLIEKRMVANNPLDDQLALFRQQASIIVRKKETASNNLKEQQDEHAEFEDELKKKRAAAESRGPRMLKNDEFKRYVAKLRTKSTTYKAKKAELTELRLEHLALKFTEEHLEKEFKELQESLGSSAEAKGIGNYQQTQAELEKISEAKSELDAQKGMTLEEHSKGVMELKDSIAKKKERLAPLITDLRDARTKHEKLKDEYDEKKANYDKVCANLETGKAKVETEVRAYREELMQEESRYHYLNTMTQLMRVQDKRIKDEVQLYIHQNNTNDGKKQKPLRDIFTKQAQEAQYLEKVLKDKQKMVADNHESNMCQLDMWRDLSVLMKCKVTESISTADAPNSSGGGGEEDRLVLNET